jgi:hypothetical protein
MPPKQGIYNPKNPEKYINSKSSITQGKGIRYMSSWEERFFQFCDFNPAIKRWSSEPFPIPYLNEADQRMHRYFVDLYMEYVDSSGNVRKVLVEIKPKSETMLPKSPKKKTPKSLMSFEKAMYTYVTNQSKWKAATEFCKLNGLEFRIITEDDLF